MIGQIVVSFGRHYLVEIETGEVLTCTSRSKKTDFACGDQVEIQVLNKEQAVIEACLPRRTLLYRQDAFKQKLIAANVTQVIIVLAAKPAWHEELLNRCLIAAEAAGIAPLILLNKADLPETIALRASLRFYESLGYPLISLSAKESIEALLPLLSQHTSIFVGQSGMGKSTLTNALIPEAHARTQIFSEKLNAGKHTTTHTALYHLNNEAHLIDSPGLQAFGLHHISRETLAEYFPEFRAWLGQCQFHNCRHLQEPRCAIRLAVQQGLIQAHRLEAYCRLMAEERQPHYLSAMLSS